MINTVCTKNIFCGHFLNLITLFLNLVLHELLSLQHPFNCSPAWNTTLGICRRKPFIHSIDSGLLFLMSFWASKKANYSGIIRIRLLDRRQEKEPLEFKKCMPWRIYLPGCGCSQAFPKLWQVFYMSRFAIIIWILHWFEANRLSQASNVAILLMLYMLSSFCVQIATS